MGVDIAVDDRQLLERCVAGSTDAFRAFVVRYQRLVFAVLSRMIGPGPDVEDLAQETFVRAHRAFKSFDLSANARATTWLVTIAVRLAIDARRKRAHAPTGVPKAIESRTPEDQQQDVELGLAIAHAADALPDDQRAAFILAEFHDMSMAEIAEVLAVPEATAKTRLFRAREKMRAALSAWRNDE